MVRQLQGHNTVVRGCVEGFDALTSCHKVTGENGVREETDVKLDGELHLIVSKLRRETEREKRMVLKSE